MSLPDCEAGPSDNLMAAATRLLHHCGDLRSGEVVAVVFQEETRAIGEALTHAAANEGAGQVHSVCVPPLSMHGVEPPSDAAEAMGVSDLIMGLTRYSMAHTHARREASKRGARYLSLPDYDEGVLTGQAMQTNFRSLQKLSEEIASAFTCGNTLRLTSAGGSDLTVGIEGRTGNAAPGWCFGPGSLASPPDAEANVAPVETSAEGLLVIDGSIPHPLFGILDNPLSLQFENGRVVDVSGHRAEVLLSLLETASHRVAAEIGVGLNPNAQLTGRMLEDEGCANTVHVGLGSNATIGGLNKVPFHLDGIIRDAQVFVDGIGIANRVEGGRSQ